MKRTSLLLTMLINMQRKLTAALFVAFVFVYPTWSAASVYSDEELAQLFKFRHFTSVVIVKPGVLKTNYSVNGSDFYVFVINNDKNILFVWQAKAPHSPRLENLNTWNAENKFQAFRGEGDVVGLSYFLLTSDLEGNHIQESFIQSNLYIFSLGVVEFENSLIAASKVYTPETSNNATPATSNAAVQRTFPEIVEEFAQLSELQVKPWVKDRVGESLNGRGTISEVERCGFLDQSERHGRKCLKVLIESGVSKALLYYPESRQAELATLNVGQNFRFEHCSIVDFRDLGFWQTVVCDTP